MCVTQRFDVLAFGAHPDDVEVAMGGTIAKLSDKGLTTLLVDLCDGEPTRHASRGARQVQAAEAARILGVTRLTLDFADRLIQDTVEARLRGRAPDSESIDLATCLRPKGRECIRTTKR